MKIKNKILSNQYGMVSITVTIVFIVVISLVVLGFSQVSRRNSRETLDRQLSSQAFYAAETGVKDVQNKIATMLESGEELTSQTECKDSKYTRNDGKVGDKSDAEYTCLLVDVEPKTLDYTNVSSGSSIIVPLNSTEGTLNENEIVWKRTSAAVNSNVANCPSVRGGNPWTNFPKSSPSTNWNCPFGVLRIELMPVIGGPGGTLSSADAAAAASMVVFAYPQQGNINDPTTVTYSTGNTGKVIAAKCNNDECRIKIDGLNFANALMRARTMYADASSFQIRADGFDATVDRPNSDSAVSGGNAFKNGQVVIDVTAKSQDVLRRIQVRGSLTGGTSRTDSSSFSDFAIRSNETICKRYETSPGYILHVNAQGSECN